LVEERENDFNGLFKSTFCVDEKNLLFQITKNIISKIKRIKIIELEKGKLSRQDMGKNIETAFRSGFYMHFRDLMNKRKGNNLSLEKRIANYYFVREFCYGSMFRYNSNGDFNIPYGGIGYNRKDFRKKASHLLSNNVQKLFGKTSIKNTDFENIFNNYEFNKDDFIFLDPPYDTDFSDYDNTGFNRDDHKRLAKCLLKTKANFLLIIKETPFINDLYQGKDGIKIESFEKKYLYNVKGRNTREVKHLIICNYEKFKINEQAAITFPPCYI
jgi:DNA adenine methylase